MIDPPQLDVALIEDDRVVREGVRALIDGTAGFRCVAAFAAAEEALAWRGTDLPHVVLVDVELPGLPGSQAIPALRRRWPGAVLLMLTVFEDEDNVFEALCNGADGYLLKRTPPARLIEALREAHEGGGPMSPEIARKVIGALRGRGRLRQRAGEPALAPQELRLLQLLAEGCSYHAAAEQLGVTVNTVRTYVRRVYQKLHVHSASAAVSAAMRAGLL